MSDSLRADSLGVGAVIFFVVSAAGPLVAIAGGIPVAMLLGNGAGIPAMFVVAAAILLAFSAGFTAMTPHVESAGGFYAYAAKGLGGHAAGMAAALAIFSYSAVQIAVYGLFGVATSDLIGAYFNVEVSWWVCSLGAASLIAMLGYRQVDLSAKVLGALVVGEYLVVLMLDIAILGASDTEFSVAAFSPGVISSGAPWIGLLLCFSAFLGFEATTIYSEEAKNPQRTIPIATYASLLLIGGFYVFSSWCLVAAVGHERILPALASLQDPTTFVFILSDRLAGPGLTHLMRLLFVTSCFAALLAFHNAVARYIFALAREGLLPHFLSRTHAVHGSPHFASCAQSATAIILVMSFAIAGADPIAVLFARMSALGTLGIIALMTLTSFAVCVFFRDRPGSAWRVRVLPGMATIGLCFVLMLACWRFDTLAGGESALVRWLPAGVGAVAIAGCLLAARLLRKDPKRFQAIGSGAA